MATLIILAAVAVLAADTPGAAAAAPTAKRPIGAPSWERWPSGDDFARVYPSRAARRGVEGRTVMSCTIKDDGHMDVCTIVSEEPTDEGFGAAAVKLGRRFKMTPTTSDGVPVGGGSVSIPIRWSLH